MDKEDMGYFADDVEFEYLANVEEVPEPVYEAIPVPAGPWPYLVLAECFMEGFANGVETCRPAPIEVEAEVIKTEINRPTRGLLNESDH